jgi:Leu/Phe-tRNA-protein transferase
MLNIFIIKQGYDDLIGKSIFACHNDKSKEKITAAVEKLKNHSMELYLGVNVKTTGFIYNL